MAEFDSGIPQQKLTVPEAIVKLREIRWGLATLVSGLHENIQALDEDPDFQNRMRYLQRSAEAHASSLEDEVQRLRSDIQTIKDFFGEDAEKKTSDSE